MINANDLRSPSFKLKPNGKPFIELVTDVISNIKGFVTEKKKIVPEYETKQLDKSNTNYDITTFIRCLFHDFRGPLNNIYLGVDLLSQSIAKTEENVEIFRSINESCEFLNDSLDGFLNIQKINNYTKISDIQSLVYEPFNIVGLLKNLQYILMLNIMNKKIQIMYHIQKVDEWVTGDKKHIHHVLMNLLLNAIKYCMQHSIIRIYLDSINITELQKKYIIRIEDENDPIPQKIKNKLFEKYNTNNSDTGTGLGLFICYQIITKHGGTIEHSYSNTDKGNIFTISLMLNICSTSSQYNNNLCKVDKTHGVTIVKPCDKVDMLQIDTPSFGNVAVGEVDETDGVTLVKPSDANENINLCVNGASSADGVHASDNVSKIQLLNSGRKASSLSIFGDSHSKSNIKHCMVIDDSEISRKFMIKLLNNTCTNITIFDAVDGLDGLVKLIKLGETMQPVDMIFVDNVMPNLTGEFLSKILRCIGYKGLIIGITGNGLKKDIDQFLDNGADYVFIKPFNKNKLQKILEFIQSNGYVSKLNTHIIEKNGKLIWDT